MSKIGPADLDERLGDDDVVVLDVRPADNYRLEHIDGSMNAPVYDDLRRGDFDALDRHLSSIPRDADVVTVCKAGIVAKRATAHLSERGYDARTLTGGYAGWKRYENGTLTYRLSSFIRGLVS